MTLDRLDRVILAALESDARLSYAELGERIGLSKSPTWKRVQALETAGLIRGYRTVLDQAQLGLETLAFVRATVSFDMHDAFEAAVLYHPRIMECHATVGDEDYLLKDLTKGMPGLDEFLRQDFWRLPGVRRFSTTIAMRTIKSTASLLENTNT